jgi:hypothetical protein
MTQKMSKIFFAPNGPKWSQMMKKRVQTAQK